MQLKSYNKAEPCITPLSVIMSLWDTQSAQSLWNNFYQGLAGTDLLRGNTPRVSQPSSSRQGLGGTGSQSYLNL